MLSIKYEKNIDKYNINYFGNNYDVFTDILSGIKKEFHNGWYLDQNSLNLLSGKLKLPQLNKIGENLKLTPYLYQKEAIFQALSVDGGALLLLPCGSGKTPIGISLYSELKKAKKIKSKGLIVVKASLKLQWYKEVEKFSDYTSHIIETNAAINSFFNLKIRKLIKEQKEYIDLDSIVYAKEIADLDKQIKEYEKKAKTKFKEQFDYDLLILNYETLADELVMKQLKKENIEFIYADEIHVIKSTKAKRTKDLWKLNSAKYTYGATATPIQKNPEDLYSIFKFLQPDLFQNLREFRNQYIRYNSFGFPIGSKNEKHLHKMIEPFLVKKTQEEVSKELPSISILPQYFDIPDGQKKMTQKLLEEIQDRKNEQEALAKQLSNEQLKQSEKMKKLDTEILVRQTFAQELVNSEKLLKESDSKMAKMYMTGNDSFKIKYLLELLETLLNAEEKICIFSKFAKMQEILADEISKKFKDAKIANVVGGMSKDESYHQWHDLFTVGDYNVLLMSDAGAEGLNLNTCQYLIEFEPATSFHIQEQRRGRIVRADSTHKTVYVYQLIGIGSYDEIALKVVRKKKGYMDKIINQKMEDENSGNVK